LSDKRGDNGNMESKIKVMKICYGFQPVNGGDIIVPNSVEDWELYYNQPDSFIAIYNEN
jgi:hypothetical protein